MSDQAKNPLPDAVVSQPEGTRCLHGLLLSSHCWTCHRSSKGTNQREMPTPVVSGQGDYPKYLGSGITVNSAEEEYQAVRNIAAPPSLPKAGDFGDYIADQRYEDAAASPLLPEQPALFVPDGVTYGTTTIINGEKCCAACCKPIFQEVPSGKGAEPKTKDELIEAYARLVDAYQTKYASLRQQLRQLRLNFVRLWSSSQHYMASEGTGSVSGLNEARADLRQFLTDTEPPDEMLLEFDDNQTLRESLVAAQSQLTEAQGKVSQLEAELRTIDATLARRPALADLNTRGEKIERAISVAKRVDELTSQVSVLTKEREEIAKALMLFYHADMVEEDAAWELQMEPDSEYFATLPEACKAFYDLMDRECLKADKRLSAVSEVVRTAKAADDSFWLGRLGGGTLTQDNVRRLNLIRTELMAALTNYEKAQQKG